MSTDNEPFRISQPRWKTLENGRRSLEVSIQWGALPPALERKVRRGAIAYGKALVEERIRALEAQLDGLKADVAAMGEMLEEEEDAPE